MTALRVVVVDDEPIMRSDLTRMLNNLPGVNVVGEGRNGAEALQLVRDLTPDALFLDVEMPVLNGLDVVSALGGTSAPFVVFVTAYDRYATQAFDVEAVDYLLKPFDSPRLVRCVERVRTRRQHVMASAGKAPSNDYAARVGIRIGNRIQVIEMSDVQWISAAGNYVELHTATGVHVCRRTMRDLERVLNPAEFMRIHRSTIVRLSCVRDLRAAGAGDWIVQMVAGDTLRLSRSYREPFVERLGRVG